MWQRVQRIACQPPGIGNAWKIRTRPIRSGVTEGDVTFNVRGDAAHPAVKRRIRPIDLLLHRRSRDRSASNIYLRPLWPVRLPGILYGMNYPQRFSTADLSILHLLHHAIEERIQCVSGIWLRNAGAASGVTCLAYSRCGTERPAATAVCARSEGAHPVIKGG